LVAVLVVLVFAEDFEDEDAPGFEDELLDSLDTPDLLFVPDLWRESLPVCQRESLRESV